MKILFIDPPHKPWTFFPGIMPSPGLLAVIPAAYKSKCSKIFVLDLSIEKDPRAALIKACLEISPDIAAISGAKSAFAYETLNAAAIVRRYAPRAALIGGGNFLSSYSDDVISRGFFDIIVSGEGEIVFENLLAAIENERFSDISLIKGTAYLKDIISNEPYVLKEKIKLFGDFDINAAADGFNSGNCLFDIPEIFGVVHTPPERYIEDLDSLPLPAFEYFDMDRYTLPPLGGKVGFVISFSRGCFKKCSFCADSAFWNHRWRGFSARRCLEIIKILYYAYGRRVFYFGDSDFWQDGNRNVEFLELLEFEKKRGFHINFWIQSSVDNILSNAPLISRYRACGLYQIMCGFESVSIEVQKSFDKRITIENMKSVSSLLRKNGVLLMGMMMWGDYNDSAETLRQNLDFMVKYCDVIGPNTMLAHYKTVYFSECVNRYNINKFDVLENDQCKIIFPTSSLSAEEASIIYRDMVLKTLISKKKFIGNYLKARNARTRNVMTELKALGGFAEL